MTLTAVKAGAYLHHLHFESPDPERLARFYGDAMDMELERQADRSWLCRGPGRRLLVSQGLPKKLAHGAFACRDRDGLDELRARAAEAGADPAPFSTPLLSQDAFAVSDPDGNTAVFGLAVDDGASCPGLKGPIQHLTLATKNVSAIEGFYAGKLGFAVSDRVRQDGGEVTTSFMRSNHEHHTLACFRSERQGIDHHSYEAGEWIVIRDWADRFAARGIQLMWGPGRHGPGNNLFIFIEDPDGNWIEVSAELEVIHDRPVKEWPHAERTLNLWGRAIMRI
jgi:catechol 2,3-dioxygenase